MFLMGIFGYLIVSNQILIVSETSFKLANQGN